MSCYAATRLDGVYYDWDIKPSMGLQDNLANPSRVADSERLCMHGHLQGICRAARRYFSPEWLDHPLTVVPLGSSRMQLCTNI